MSLAAQGPGRAPRRWRFVMPVQAGLASLTGQYHSRGGGVVNTPRVHSQWPYPGTRARLSVEPTPGEGGWFPNMRGCTPAASPMRIEVVRD